MSEDAPVDVEAVSLSEAAAPAPNPLEARVLQLESELKATREDLIIMRSAVAYLTARVEAIEATPPGVAPSPTPSATPTKTKNKPSYGTLPKALPSTRPASAAPASPAPSPAPKEDAPSPTPAGDGGPALKRTTTTVRPPSKDTTPIKKFGTLPRGTSLTPQKDEEKPKTPASVNKTIAARAPESKEEEDGIDPARRGFYNLGKAKVHYYAPADAAKEEKAAVPSSDLTLDFVYGYNGKNGRDNLFVGKNRDELIYSLAGTAVVYNVATRQQRFMTHHSEDILSLAVHPNREIAATGQLDPKGVATPYILVWNVDTMEVIRKITYHDRGIVCLAFSPDGKYLASIGADDSHTVAIWDWETAGVKGLGTDKTPKNKKENDLATPLLEQMVSKDDVFVIAFNPAPSDASGGDDEESKEKNKEPAPKDIGPIDLEFVTLGVKHIKVWSVAGIKSAEKKNRKMISRIPSTYNKTKIVQKGFNSVSFVGNGEYLVATDSGHVYRFKGSQLLKFYPAHGESAVGVIVKTDDGFCTAGQDGNLKFWDADFKELAVVDLARGSKTFEARAVDVYQGRLVVGTKQNSILEVELASKEIKTLMEGHRSEVWALDVHPTDPVVVTGAHDKLLRLWNYVERAPVEGKTATLADKVRSAIFTPDGKFLAVGTWGGKMYLFSYPSMEQQWEKKVSLGETIDALAVSPDSSILAAGSWDQIIYVLAIPSGKVLHTLKGHTSSVLMVNFSTDGKSLQSNSKDYEILYWDIVKGKRLTKAAEIADLQWFGWNCFLGWPVQGIWEDTGDGTDINAVDRSHDSSVLATGDDFGRVRLYKYPVTVKDAPSKTFGGHSSHVTSVRFSPDDKYLFSTGGADTGVFQWKHGSQ